MLRAAVSRSKGAILGGALSLAGTGYGLTGALVRAVSGEICRVAGHDWRPVEYGFLHSEEQIRRFRCARCPKEWPE